MESHESGQKCPLLVKKLGSSTARRATGHSFHDKNAKTLFGYKNSWNIREVVEKLIPVLLSEVLALALPSSLLIDTTFVHEKTNGEYHPFVFMRGLPIVALAP